MTDSQPVAEAQVMVILWAALASSVLVYAVIAFVVVPSGGNGAPSFSEALSNPIAGVLHLVGLGIMAASAMLPGMLLKSTRGPGAPVSPPVAGEPLRVDPAVRTACLVQWALIEGPAVMGLVLAFLTRQPLLFVPLGLLSLIGFVLTFPSEDRLRVLGDRVNRAV